MRSRVDYHKEKFPAQRYKTTGWRRQVVRIAPAAQVSFPYCLHAHQTRKIPLIQPLISVRVRPGPKSDQNAAVQVAAAGPNRRRPIGVSAAEIRWRRQRRRRRNEIETLREEPDGRSGALHGRQGSKKSILPQRVQRRLHRRPFPSLLDENLAETRFAIVSNPLTFN